MKLLLGLVVAVTACTKPAPCPPAPASPRVASLGETFAIASKILGEQRTINVYLPPDYAKGGTFPVLYMPDGGIDEDFPHVVGAVDVSIKNAVRRAQAGDRASLPGHERVRHPRRVGRRAVRGRDVRARAHTVRSLHRGGSERVVERIQGTSD